MRRSRWRWLLAFVLLVAAAAAASPFWLPALGHLLVNAGPPRKADLILVLAGDWRGNRVLKGGELVRDGFAPLAVVSSPMHHYGVGEADLAIQYAGKHGFPPHYFHPLPIAGNSSAEEAVELLAEARRRGAKSILIVTSDYHTRRAARIYNRLRDGIAVCVTASPDSYYRAGSWWRTRESRKIWLLEFTKLVTSLVGM